jgi:hypothetical protein
MNRLRTIRGFVRILIAAFVVAQFAGVNSSPHARTETGPSSVSAHVHHQHQTSDLGTVRHQHPADHKATYSDYCCALHAFFVGIVTPPVAVNILATVSARLALQGDISRPTYTVERLDRPPRPLA